MNGYGNNILKPQNNKANDKNVVVDMFYFPLFQWNGVPRFLNFLVDSNNYFFGGGMVFQQGATTGGTDLIARLLKLKISWLPMGKLLMATDLVVIVATAIAFGSVYSALYGLVALYIASLVMDKVLYGMDSAKVAYIISDYFREIADAIVNDLDRGVTILQGQGAYSGTEKKVLMCAFKQRQIVSIKKMVRDIDPSAFVIVCDAHEVLGDGFREYQQNEL